MGQLLVGCAMWANRDWVGPFFPSSTRPGDELAQYVHWCTAVEGNTTFYALPPADTVRRWTDTTPDTFRFICKVPKSISHDQRLRGTDAELIAFLRLLAPLGPRLGTVTVQLPPSFGPGDIGVLAAFLRRAPRSVDATPIRWAVEVRHPQFFDGGRAHVSLDRLLVDVNAERVILDSRPLFANPPTDDAERDGWSKKPRVPVTPTALTDMPIVRLIGRTSLAETAAGWQPWLPVLRQWIDEGR
ncbi:MAG: DUF72 domain-containing protein, partial [Ilumatobacteraceae bacterium]